jgi:hypothetical protein
MEAIMPTGNRASRAVKFITASCLSAIMVAAGTGPTYAAQEAATEVAFVEDVSGRVVAFLEGRPTLLEALDIIKDRTQLDLLSASELRICHYQTHQLLTLKGPLRASISRDIVTVEDGKAVLASAGACAAPVVSNFQGGLLTRSPRFKATPANDVSSKR